MIQRPPACKRHAAELPGKALIVPSEKCPWCWQEEREHITDDPDPLACWCNPYRDSEEPSVIVHRKEGSV